MWGGVAYFTHMKGKKHEQLLFLLMCTAWFVCFFATLLAILGNTLLVSPVVLTLGTYY